MPPPVCVSMIHPACARCCSGGLPAAVHTNCRPAGAAAGLLPVYHLVPPMYCCVLLCPPLSPAAD